MKVLVISASPRIGGNSDILCDRFLEGAKESGHSTEKINLQNLSLNPCIGCYECGKTKVCIQNDGMTQVLQSIIEADVIVLATPVYFYSMDAQMKIFIDRCLPRYLEIQNKAFYYIITAADPQHSAADETISGLRGYLRCLPGAVEKGIIYGMGAWEKGDILNHNAMKEAFNVGKGI